mgnify:CR=1 FL=1
MKRRGPSTVARPMKPVPPALRTNVRQQIGELAQQLSNNPQINRFSVEVDNRTGVVTTNVQHRDGRVQHDEWIVEGLSRTTRFDPRALTIEDRNEAVRALLAQGLTQAEVARRIGISQSRVSQISAGR